MHNHAIDVEEEGVWRWVEGPEAGTIFWTEAGGTITFSLWTTGEPNDYRGGEDHGVLNWDYGVAGLIAIATLVFLFVNPDYRPGVYGVAGWFALSLLYFGFYARHRMILSPEEKFAQQAHHAA